jgi:membrane fusion protein (multidrug efflux system)
LVAALGTALATVGCTSSAQQPAQAPPPPTVETVVAEAGTAELYVEYPAQTYARNQVEVRGRVDGYIERWLFRPGQHVRAGQALYVLDLRPYRAQLEQAQGNLKQAEAELTNAQQQTSLLQAQANLAAAEATLVRAQQDHDRLKPLVEQDAAARQDLDAAVAELRSAESSVRANKAAVAQARLNTETLVEGAEGRVQTQRGAVRTAALNVQYGTIVAPISGIAGDTQVPVGGLVTANSPQPLTTIVPLDPIWVRFKLSEAQYLDFQKRFAAGARKVSGVELLLADGSVFPHRGTIENTLNQVDPRTGTLEVQAQFPNPQGTVLPGQFGRVRFEKERRDGVIRVPQRAVQQNQNLQSVFVVGPANKIEVRPVQIGPRVGDDWVIEQGLNPGERVVVEGLLSVRPGLTVRPVAYKNEAAQPAGPSGSPPLPQAE